LFFSQCYLSCWMVHIWLHHSVFSHEFNKYFPKFYK
jgi:hypothetical protein